MFGVEFLKNGSEIKKSPRWRKLYCNKLQNDTPYDPVEVLPKAVGGGANRFLRFLQSSRCITRGSVECHEANPPQAEVVVQPFP